MKPANQKRFLIALPFLFFLITATAQKKIERTSENEVTITKYLDSSKADPVEGIYRSTSGGYFRLGVKRVSDNKFIAVVLDCDERLKKNWKTGDVKAYLEKSTGVDTYAITWLWNDKTPTYISGRLNKDGLLVNFSIEDIKLLKVYPLN